jgi:hypothetical protein
MEPSTNVAAIALVTTTEHAIEPWDRHAGESDAAWAAFRIYRDLRGRRSYVAVTESLGRTPGYVKQIEKWGNKYEWVERAYRFDLDEDRRARDRMEERKAAMELRQEEIGRVGMEMILARLKGGTVELEDGTVLDVDALDPSRWSPQVIAVLLREFRDTERLAHNLPTDFTKGLFMFTAAEGAKVVERIVGIAHDFWGTDPRWGMYIEKVKALKIGPVNAIPASSSFSFDQFEPVRNRHLVESHGPR